MSWRGVACRGVAGRGVAGGGLGVRRLSDGFVILCTAIRLTGAHLVRVATTPDGGAFRSVQARLVKVGMLVWATGGGSDGGAAGAVTAVVESAGAGADAFAWRRVTRVDDGARCTGGLMTIQTLNRSVVVDGVLASCFELHERWGAFESADMRFWYRVAPSVMRSATYHQLSAMWDNYISEPFARLLASGSEN